MEVLRPVQTGHHPQPAAGEISAVQPAGSPVQASEGFTPPEKAEAARTLVSATRKQARFKPAEMVLREMLEAAFVVMDEDFMPSLGRNGASGEGRMT